MSFHFNIFLVAVAIVHGPQGVEPPGSSEATPLDQRETVWSHWIQRLDEAKYIQIEERCSRVSSLPVNNQPSENVIEEHYILAKAFMTEDALLVTVWETDAEWNPLQPNAVLVMAWADNTVTEKMWYPALGVYRTKRFPALTHFGPANTDHEHGCQFGVLLVTWLREGPGGLRPSQEYMKSASPVIELEANQSDYGLILKAEVDRIVDEESGKLEYSRVDEMYFSPDALFTRWVTTVYQAMDDEVTKALRAHPDPYFIVQDQSFELSFPETAPAEFQEAIDRMMQEEVSD